MGQVKNRLLDRLNDEAYRERLCLLDLFDPVEPDYPGWEANDDPFVEAVHASSDERPF